MKIYTFEEKLPNEDEEILIVLPKEAFIDDKYLPRFFEGVIKSDQGPHAITTKADIDSDQYWPLDTHWCYLPKINQL